MVEALTMAWHGMAAPVIFYTYHAIDNHKNENSAALLFFFHILSLSITFLNLAAVQMNQMNEQKKNNNIHSQTRRERERETEIRIHNKLYLLYNPTHRQWVRFIHLSIVIVCIRAQTEYSELFFFLLFWFVLSLSLSEFSWLIHLKWYRHFSSILTVVLSVLLSVSIHSTAANCFHAVQKSGRFGCCCCLIRFSKIGFGICFFTSLPFLV